MKQTQSQTSNITVVQVDWLSASAFAEVGETSKRGKTKVYLSKSQDPKSVTVKNRIGRLVSHLTNSNFIGEDECELAVA